MAYILKNNARPSGSEVRNIKVGDTETKYIIRGDGALFYDIQMYIIYDVPNISFVYPDTITPAKGGSIKPIQQSFTQAWRRVGYSGNMYEQEQIIEGATINYYIISGEGASVDENGEVTWESRDITFDENEREAIVQMTVTINGQENYAIATVKQAKNIIEKIDYDIPTGKSLTVLDIPAEGGIITSGQTSGTIVQLRTDTYSSEEKNTYEINPDISSDYYSDPVIAESLRTTIKERSKVGVLTYYYNCNGIIGECSADVYQKLNGVTSIDIKENTLSYDDIDAGATSAYPNSSQAPKFWFSSGDSSDVIPNAIYGSFDTYITYTLTDAINGFNVCDWLTGELFATSRGTEYGADYRTSGMVTKLVNYSWNPISYEYGDFVEISGSVQASCKQKPNLIIKLELQNPTSGSISTPDIYPAKGDIKNIANIQSANSGCLVTFSSTESTIDYSNWVNLEIDYTWSTNKTYVSITSTDESCTARMFSRGTDYDTNNREAIVTRTATITASLKTGYINAESVSTIVDCYTTITQDPNTITITSITVTPGAIGNPGLYPAKGDIKIVENKEESTAIGILTFDSEEQVEANSTYGKWSGPNYFWESNQSYASCSGSGSSCSVEMDNRDTIVGDARSATITRNVNWTYTLSSNYGGDSSTEDHSALVVIWQEANEADVRSEITEYGVPDISIDSTYLTAAGGYCTISSSVINVRTYYYTSESPGRTEREPGQVSLSIQSQYFSTSSTATTGTSINRYSISGTKLSHSSMDKNVGYDHVVVKATNIGDLTKTNTASTKIQNVKDATNQITSYGDVTISIDSSELTAGGGYCTVTYGQTNIRTYYYTSGAISKTENIPGSVTIAIDKQTLSSSSTSHSSTSINRYSRNGNVLNHTTMGANVGYDVVTVKATGEGGKTNSATTSVRNVANASSKITAYGVPSVSIGALYAYESETTVTYSVKNTKTYYYTSGAEGTSEQISGSVTAEMTTNGNNRFTFTDPGLKHASMGTSATTDKVVIKVTNNGDTSKTNTASKSITNYADASYGTPEITGYSYALFPTEGGTKSPSVSYYQYSYYTSGSYCNTYTSGGSLTYSMSPNPSNGFTLSTNGKMTAAENTVTSDRSPSSMPKVYVTMNGKSSSWYTCTYCVQERVKIRYVIDDKWLSFSAAGGSQSFTPTYKIYEGDSLISSGNILSGYTITSFSADNPFTLEGTTISIGVNYSSYYGYNGTYIISKTGYTSGSIYCSQNNDSISRYSISITSNRYKYSSSPCPENGGSCTITATAYAIWESGYEEGPYKPTLSSNHSKLTIGELNSNYQATAKWASNAGGDPRSGRITASYGGYSNYVTIYQQGLHITNEYLVSNFYYDEGKPNYTSSNSVTPKFDYIKHYVYWSDGDSDVYNLSLSDCYDYYSFISGDTSHFTLTGSSGKVKFKTVNKSGDERRATVECELEYYSPYTGDTIYDYPTADVVQESYHYYLTLVNPYNKDIQAIICYGYTPADPGAHGEITEESILVPAGESFKIDVTKGIQVNIGSNGSVTTKTSNCQLKIYSWDGENMVYSGNLDFIMYYEGGLTHGL